ncbi:MAG: phosphonoacetaldehyde hydrolase [Oscillospiraceae bacterium]|nr:phosphonoacetaldehyde hydrolase [Oscillospiraceae bacterium]
MEKNTKIAAVIFDWAGTIVDFGCMAPIKALRDVFEEAGIPLTNETARRYMGLSKKEHIQKTLQLPEVSDSWKEKFHKIPSNQNVERLYHRFQTIIFSYLEEYSMPVPGAVHLFSQLREQGIAIGSTTGYTREMARAVAQKAKQDGLFVDCCVTPDDVPAGRPYPWMCFQNAMKLNVCPPRTIVKVGDTVSDVLEGKNAGMWSVAVLNSGSELGVSQKQLTQMSADEYKMKTERIRQKFLSAGADYVIDSISELTDVIDRINAGNSAGQEGNQI